MSGVFGLTPTFQPALPQDTILGIPVVSDAGRNIQSQFGFDPTTSVQGLTGLDIQRRQIGLDASGGFRPGTPAGGPITALGTPRGLGFALGGPIGAGIGSLFGRGSPPPPAPRFERFVENPLNNLRNLPGFENVQNPVDVINQVRGFERPDLLQLKQALPQLGASFSEASRGLRRAQITPGILGPNNTANFGAANFLVGRPVEGGGFVPDFDLTQQQLSQGFNELLTRLNEQFLL